MGASSGISACTASPERSGNNGAPQSSHNSGSNNIACRNTSSTPASCKASQILLMGLSSSDTSLSASLFGKDYVPAGQEVEKGTEIALRATLTGFADVMQSSLAFKDMRETDVKTVLTRFPALEGRDLAKQKHELHFEEFANCYKSKDACTRELAGGLHALLAGQEILRVSSLFLSHQLN